MSHVPNMTIKITILQSLLNTQDFSSVGLDYNLLCDSMFAYLILISRVCKCINMFSLFMSAGSSVHNGLTVELSLQFVAEGDTCGHTKKRFITDIEDFKNGLFIYPISRIWP